MIILKGNWLERSPAKHGTQGLILNWVIISKTLFAASLALTLSIKELRRG